MKVSIDTKFCSGHARCAALAPEVFDLDDDGYALPLQDEEVPAACEKSALAASRACPERAITIG